MLQKLPLSVCILLFLCASRLHADIFDDDKEGLQAAFSQFPLLNLQTNQSGEPVFQTLPWNQPVKVNGRDYYGFRFQVPKRKNGEDFVWAFCEFGAGNWYILPETGTMNGFSSYDMRPKSDYLGTNQLFPLNARNLYLQNLPGDSLEDGKTYLIWFHRQQGKPAKISLAFTFAPKDPGITNSIKAIEKPLGLDHATGPPIVNPANHHTYILLRQATWKKSEARAAALGGHLATVRNQSEEDWLVKTFGRNGGAQRLLWIGLNDTVKKFHFGWSSGESLSYTCWAPGEPNNAGRGEDFVAIYYPGHSQGGKWNDWDDQTKDPIGLPMNGVVEIIPKDVENLFPLASKEATNNHSAVNLVSAETNSADHSTVLQNAVEIRPTLIISSQGGSIKLQWPLSMSDYMLEATTNLGQRFAMFGYSEMTNQSAGTVYVTVTNPSPQMFFRLRRP